jgi:hypothetical protein
MSVIVKGGGSVNVLIRSVAILTCVFIQRILRSSKPDINISEIRIRLTRDGL